MRAKLLAVAHQHECWLYATPQMLRAAGIDSRTRLEGVMRSYDVEAGLFMCEDLYTYFKDDIFLVSKDKEIFDKISQLFISN